MLNTLKDILLRNGYTEAAKEIEMHNVNASVAVAAWNNWGSKSKIPTLTQVDYE